MNVALVTGGTRGIGLAIARKLASDGFNLILGYHSDRAAALEAKHELEKFDVNVVTVAGDIAAIETVDSLFKAVEEDFDNQLTAFVHVAGYAITATLPGGFTFEQYEEAQNLYPKAFLRCMEKALIYMPDGRGRAIAISASGIHNPGKVYAMSAPAKAGMEVLAKHYAIALAPRGITVNVISPGYIKTQAWNGYLELLPEIDQVPAKSTPMGRWGQPEDIAPLVAFLCSQDSGFITGQHIYVDGGLSLSLFWNIHRLSEHVESE
ncbi:SDR family NAD(P)-dependent oxidoreductase [Synechococcus sp. PCC 7336]|uniref:SDR family NAD(P)-dependent oxidoreductase n=1 Tax=Synechococcus sp. PCC 7336 TaxID=195250 RepID=UPI000371C1F0|nr:SDR family oxidoreductase [Synechococcus sp. PCC 7336]